MEIKYPPPIEYRLMTLFDVAAGMMLKEANGWNQLEADWLRFLKFRPQGCFVAEVEGNVVGTVASVAYGNRCGWIGLMLVDAQFRRRGIGRQLMELAIESLQDCDTIKLDATPAGRGLYETLGFREEYSLLRLVCPALPVVDLPPVALPPFCKTALLNAAELSSLAMWNEEVFGADRGELLQDWLAESPSWAVGVKEESGQWLGFRLSRAGAIYRQIGPVLAVNQATAQALLVSALSETSFVESPEPLLIDIPCHTPSWSDFLKTLGFEVQRPLLRMVRGPNRTPGLVSHQWAIGGPEWG